MEGETQPPAYAPPPARRSILDLRAQIIANASVMKPRLNEQRSSDDHLEVILAKAPAVSAAPPGAAPTHWGSEKQALAMMEQSQSQNLRLTPTGSLASSSSVVPRPGQHYAVLVRRNTGSTVKIILKGEPKETPEDALEWMLEQTEKLVHDLVVRRGRPANEGCCVM